MKKLMMIAVILLLSYSASAKELTKKENVLPVATEENTEDVFLLVEAEKGVFFYLWCRKGLNSKGEYYWLWCKNVRNGIVTYADPKDYPELYVRVYPTDPTEEALPAAPAIDENQGPVILPWE